MRKYLLGTALVAALAGCTADWDPGRESASATAPADNDAAKFQLPRDPAHSFASLPDQGALLAYDQTRKTRTAGAYTSRPVKISEAHALNAIAKGEMVLPGPDGQPIRLGYSSHEEHADGSWSWVGQDEAGNSSVLTFGQDAVFGRIASGGEIFNVRTNASGAWLIQTDSTKLAGLGGQPTGADADFLAAPGNASISGVLDSAVASAAPSMASAEATTVASKAATVVVDLVLGYTNGLVTQAGSQSAALTQLNNLVATANQAYVNSGINYRVRLVQAVLVNYADNNSNQDTLRKLTGYNEETKQPITVDAAFTALRAARDQYGGDLVSLIRPHRSPEQNGCGIAWLLGAGGSAITAAKDAAFGYSVVSVGIDLDESDSKNYLCSDDTLAHELGHNMGQVHNQENATTSGAHAYSYGYREASTSGFHTIMAYPLPSSAQASILNFANPNVSVNGRTTGVSSTSDNARSMNQTMPLVASFRQRVVPFGGGQNDFDGDGFSDIYWRNSVTGRNELWTMKGSSLQNSAFVYLEADQRWKVIGSGDFNGDGKSDLLWRHDTTGQVYIQHMNGAAILSSSGYSTTVADVRWKIAALGDFDGDGVTDILWKNTASGAHDVWLMAGLALKQQRQIYVEPNLAWQVVGAGDFNGDGRDDILWRNTATGQNYILFMNGASIQSAGYTQTVSDLAWGVAAINDFDGDGYADIYWRNKTTGANHLWFMNGTSLARVNSAVYQESNQAWAVVNSGDYNGDGYADVLWRNSSTGQNYMQLMENGTVVQGVQIYAVPDTNWRIISSDVLQ